MEEKILQMASGGVVESEPNDRRVDEEELKETLQDLKDELVEVQIRPPTIRNKGNTGPKGVLADYAEAKENLKKRMQRESEKFWRDLEKTGIKTKREQERDNKLYQQQKQLEDEFTEEDLEDLVKGDEFFKKYMEQRRGEIYQTIQELKQDQNSYSVLPTFGFLRQIQVDEYLDEVDGEDSSVVVIIHLFENHIPPCKVLNQALQTLARKYYNTKFLKIISSEANKNFDEIALPALLVYQGGQLVHTFLCLSDADELGKKFDPEDVEAYLFKAGVKMQPTRAVAVVNTI
eukprot:TRINITY_DN3304_c0_g7_i1.p1 TRINITY_DN3304_c0_g7~~TRINITY_DN3304_c0_g7_i1.p1  ORF type:complete len:289 (-),score=93.22 TRINITY_DN3304_c0_g7_i1:133-999(-)